MNVIPRLATDYCISEFTVTAPNLQDLLRMGELPSAHFTERCEPVKQATPHLNTVTYGFNRMCY